MSESSVETVRRLFERLDDGGVDAALELISEDFVAEVPPSMSAEPDVYEGHDGVRRYFAGFDDLIEDVRFEPIEFFDHGEAVLIWMRVAGRGAVSGIEVELPAALITRVRDGQVTAMEPHPDLESARQVLAS